MVEDQGGSVSEVQRYRRSDGEDMEEVLALFNGDEVEVVLTDGTVHIGWLVLDQNLFDHWGVVDGEELVVEFRAEECAELLVL